MFGVDSSEFLIVAVAALIFIGPKDLPRVMRVVGQWVGRARGMARHFTSGIENIIREAELEEMERKWRDENARIMAEYPAVPPDPSPPAQDSGVSAAPPHEWAVGSTMPYDAEEPALPLDLPRRELP